MVQDSWSLNTTGNLLPYLSCAANDFVDWGKKLARRFWDDINKCKKNLEILKSMDDTRTMDLYKETQCNLFCLLTNE